MFTKFSATAFFSLLLAFSFLVTACGERPGSVNLSDSEGSSHRSASTICSGITIASTPTIAGSAVTNASTPTIAGSAVTIASTPTTASSAVTNASTPTIASSGISVFDLAGSGSFDLSDSTISMILMVFGDKQDCLEIQSLRDPEGNELMHSFPLNKSHKSFGYSAAMLPITTNQIITPGRWSFIADTHATSVKLVVRSGPNPTRSFLKIRPYLTGTMTTTSQVRYVLAETKKIFAKAGINTEFDPVQTVSGSEYRVVSGDFRNPITAKLISMGPAGRINVFFVEGIEGNLKGASGGLPGSQWVAGPRNGVLVAINPYAYDWLDNKRLGEITGHEIGHFLGLHHTSEQVDLSKSKLSQEYDPILDTPQCPLSLLSSCQNYDRNNLMFWELYDGAETLSLSPGQAEIIRKSPISRESPTTSMATSTSTTTPLTCPTTPTTTRPDSRSLQRFVAIGLEGTISYSTDGNSWTQSDGNIRGIEGMAYGNEHFVAVGERAYYSTNDGNSWTPSKSVMRRMQAVAYGNGRFVAVGNGRAYYSTDGSSWQASDNNPPELMWAIAYGNRRFVAVSFSRAHYSTDNGKSWKTSNYNFPKKLKMRAIAYGNGCFVAVGARRAYYSTDGNSWQASDANLPEFIRAIAYGNGHFMAVGWGGGGSYSTDNGRSWTQSDGNIGIMNAIVYGNSRFVAVGWGGRSYSTDNGRSWQASNYSKPMTSIAVSD